MLACCGRLLRAHCRTGVALLAARAQRAARKGDH